MAAQCSLRLKAGEQDAAFLARQIVAQVVPDASRVAHAAGGNDDRARTNLVQRHGFLGAFREMQIRQVFAARVPSCQALRLFVEQLKVFARDARGFRGHRRINEYSRLPQPPLAGETVQVVQDFLGSTDREGRHDDVATAFEQGFLDDADHLLFGCRKVLVLAVAIGGLDDEDVGVLDGCRVAQYRASRLAKVAAEYQFCRVAVLGDPDFDDGRPEDVPGIAKARAHPDPGRELPVVFDASYLLQAFARILQRVQRRQRILSAEPLGTAFCIALLDVCTVGQHHAQQINRGGSGVDGPFEPGAGEFGQ